MSISKQKSRIGLQMVEPGEEGFSEERLARIGTSMQRYIDNQIIPGILTVVARHGRIVHFESQGLMDIENNKPMKNDTIFRKIGRASCRERV